MTDPNPARADGESIDLRRTAVEIVAISGVVLFQELALIRWLPGQVRVLAYFPNLILISAFFGLGVGCLRAHRRPLLWLWPTSLAMLVLAAVAGSRVAFTQSSESEHFWLLYADLPSTALVVQAVQPPIVLAFLLAALPFVPLGQMLAERLERFRAASSSLWGYAWDIVGSLLGVVGFAVVGYRGMPPWTWFALFLAVGSLLFGRSWGRRLVHLAAAIAIVTVVVVTERAEHYSPYYALTTTARDGDRGFNVLANGSLHQVAAPVARRGEPVGDWERAVRTGYHAPYDLLGRPPRQALVIGAGTGNDVSVLLDRGAERVDAVEIDPVILELGRDHPDRPYDSDRVRRINTDARSFLNHTDSRYDVIVFGTLDSLTRLSALSNVRLDNFVYTRECIAAAADRLTPDGVLLLYFGVATDYIDDRLFGLLAETFDRLPVVRREYSYLFNRIYMAGPGFAHLPPPPADVVERYRTTYLPTVLLPTDDWPYLYLRERALSGFYASLIAIFVVLAGASVAVASRSVRASLVRGRGVDLEMFLYGFAFLLLEATFITAMNLVWGATWSTSAVVFGSVLAMILVSTILMQLKPLPWPVAAGGLVLALLVAAAVPVRWLLVDGTAGRLALSVLLVGGPIFFASACFALRFRTRAAADVAFGWNLLGAVTGGLAEMLSMVTGLRSLVLLATVAYLLSFLIRSRPGSRPAG